MAYDNKKIDNRIVIFISDYGFRLLSQCERCHGDGTFFSTPEPFNQVYLIHAYKQNQMLPAAYILLKFRRAWQTILVSKPQHIHVDPILNYFEKTWITGKCPILMWNHFEEIGPPIRGVIQ